MDAMGVQGAGRVGGTGARACRAPAGGGAARLLRSGRAALPRPTPSSLVHIRPERAGRASRRAPGAHRSCSGTAVHRPSTFAATHTGAPGRAGVSRETCAHGSWNCPQPPTRSRALWNVLRPYPTCGRVAGGRGAAGARGAGGEACAAAWCGLGRAWRRSGPERPACRHRGGVHLAPPRLRAAWRRPRPRAARGPGAPGSRLDAVAVDRPPAVALGLLRQRRGAPRGARAAVVEPQPCGWGFWGAGDGFTT
jgi:hypothetical protein